MSYRFESKIIRPTKYIPAEKTDIAATFRQVKRELEVKKVQNVRPIKKKVA